MLAAAVPAMATTEGIIQGDIMMISEEPVVEDVATTDELVIPSYYQHKGTVEAVAENSIDVTIDGMTVTFATTEATLLYTIDGEKAEAVKAGDMVIVASQSPLMSRDIKAAEAIVITNAEAQASIYLDTFNMDEEQLISADGELVLNVENAEEYAGKKLLVFYSFVLQSLPAQTTPDKVVVVEEAATEEPVEDIATPEVVVPSYYRHAGTVAAVNEGSVDVTIDEMTVTFATTDATLLYTIDGEKAEAVKAGDMVIVLSASPLMSRDIKEAAAIVITNEESQVSVYLDTFNMVEGQLLSADGDLVLNMEKAEDYAGKKLLVFYDMMTMSIPAQTAPIKVVEVAEVLPEATDSVSVKFNIGDSAINVNGEVIEVEKPYIAGAGTTLVPMRVIAEAFGAQVIWNGEAKSVTVNLGDKSIVVTINSKTALVNGEEMALEEAPELTENGFSMIPLRFISEQLGAEVGYIHETQTITVEK